MWNESVWMLAGAMVLFSAGPASGQPQPGWSDQFATGDLYDGEVRCITDFDEDGPGPGLPRLFACGTFRTAGIGGPWVGGIARWDGLRWTDVGGSSPSPGLGINALIVFDEDGPGPEPEALYVGGNTVNLGGIPGVYRWDGSTWTSAIRLRTGNLTGLVNDFAVFDEDGDGPELPKLFAAGRLSVGNESWQMPVARWDGVRWTPVGSYSTSPGQANAMAVFDEDGPGPARPSLYIGGNFILNEPDATYFYCARWDGIRWSSVGDGIGGDIRDFAVFDPDGDYSGQGHLYAAGSISVPGMSSNQALVRWDGQSWGSLPISPGTYVSSILSLDLDGSGPTPRSLLTNADGVTRWDGLSWTRMQNESYLDQMFCRSMVAFDDDGDGGRAPLFMTGGNIGSGPDSVYGVTQWTGRGFSGVGNGIWRGTSSLRAIDLDGIGPESTSLIATGWFSFAGGTQSRGIAKWCGESWESIGNISENVSINSIDTVDFEGQGSSTLLVAGGFFPKLNGLPCGHVGYWDGQSWTPAATTMIDDSGQNAQVSFIKTVDEDGPASAAPFVYVAGRFTSIDGVACSRIARWDGQAWYPLGDGIEGEYFSIRAMEAWDPDGEGPQPTRLFVGGDFEFAGGVPVSGIAAWNGDAWMPLGNAVSGSVDSIFVAEPEALDVIPAGFLVGGSMTFADGTQYSGILRLENHSWSIIAGRKFDGQGWKPVGGVANLYATAMRIVDVDGPGREPEELLVLGEVQIAGGSTTWKMARWDGVQWNGFGDFGGYARTPRTLEVFDEDSEGPNPPGLYVGGQFNSVDGVQSVGIARWGLRVPYIVRQPGDLRRGVGESALFNVKAGGGDTLSYQWRIDGSDLVDDGRHSGANTETLRISSLRLADRGQYEVVITNSAGIKTSRAARLDIFCNSSRITPDLNHDRAVDGHDIQFMVDALLSLSTSDAGLCTADLNGDLLLDAEDLHLFVGSLLSQ